MRHRISAVAWLGLLLTLAACDSQQSVDDVEFRVPVSAREVGTGVVEDRIVATGSLRSTEIVSLRSETSGALRYGTNAAGQRLREGDRVKSGDVIAEITGEDVRLAARTESTLQRYQVALRDFESKQKLFDDGLLSEAEFRPLQSTLADAKIELERSQLTEVRSKLITPIGGVVLVLARDEQDVPLADGQLVVQNFVVAQIAPNDELIAEVDLVGADVARVRPGLVARVRYHAWDEDRFDGTLIRVAPALDPTTRTLRAEVRVDNGKRLLRPGMFVEVTLIVERRVDVPVVPRDAVAERGGARVVFVLNGQKVSQRKVVLGLGDDDIVEVREGVALGERVVVRGLETLTDNQNVRVSGT